MQQSGHAWFHVIAPLHADREVMLAVVGKFGSVYYHLPVLRDDREVMLAAVHQGGGALALASNVLRWDSKWHLRRCS